MLLCRMHIRGTSVKRRKFIGLTGAAAVWPVSSRAQQTPAVGPTMGLLVSESIADWMIAGAALMPVRPIAE